MAFTLRRMRALVTGGAGFIGSNLVDALLERGDEVTVVDDLSTGRRENLDRALARGATLVEADVRDGPTMREVIDRARPSAIHHLAAQIDIRRSVADPRFDLEVNVGGTIALLEAARIAGTPRFVFASTGGAIYGEGAGRELPFAEDTECRPDAPYGQSKFAAEGYVGVYERLYGLGAVSLRLGNVYGPRQDPLGEAGVAAIFAGALLDGRTPTVYGDGRQTRDYVYVGDVAAAFMAAADATATGVFNVGTGIETSVLDLGRRLAAAAGTAFEPEHAPRRPGEVQRVAIDPSHAAAELGWRAQVELAAGLERTLEWARDAAAQREPR
jgi:UDP-glucose 4-epimerase